MRKSLDHYIEGTTRFVADFSTSLSDGVTIELGAWQLDRHPKLLVTQTVEGAKAGVEIRGGEPGCQYVLEFVGKATDDTSLRVEYWLNTRRNPADQATQQIEPDISTEPGDNA